MSGRHWSEGTPFENVKAGAPVAGMPWTLSPANPAPPGFAVAAGRLVALPGYGYATDVDGSPVPLVAAAGKSGAGSAPGAEVDVLLAEARATGWSPQQRLRADAWCGKCTPCRNRSRSQCIHRGTAYAQACMKVAAAAASRSLFEASLDGQIAALEHELLHANDRYYRELDSDWVWAG